MIWNSFENNCRQLASIKLSDTYFIIFVTVNEVLDDVLEARRFFFWTVIAVVGTHLKPAIAYYNVSIVGSLQLRHTIKQWHKTLEKKPMNVVNLTCFICFVCLNAPSFGSEHHVNTSM